MADGNYTCFVIDRKQKNKQFFEGNIIKMD